MILFFKKKIINKKIIFICVLGNEHSRRAAGPPGGRGWWFATTVTHKVRASQKPRFWAHLVLYKLAGFCRADLAGRDQKCQADMPSAFFAKTSKKVDFDPQNGQKPPFCCPKNTIFAPNLHILCFPKTVPHFRPPPFSRWAAARSV